MDLQQQDNRKAAPKLILAVVVAFFILSIVGMYFQVDILYMAGILPSYLVFLPLFNLLLLARKKNLKGSV